MKKREWDGLQIAATRAYNSVLGSASGPTVDVLQAVALSRVVDVGDSAWSIFDGVTHKNGALVVRSVFGGEQQTPIPAYVKDGLVYDLIGNELGHGSGQYLEYLESDVDPDAYHEVLQGLLGDFCNRLESLTGAVVQAMEDINNAE